MRQYELTYLVSDKVPETDLNKITGKVGGFISDDNGKVLKEEIWKRRKLAYPIKKQEFATYVTLNFELPVEAVRNLDQEIKLTSQIIRHLLILKEMGEEKLSLVPEEIVGAEEIESVIGGEKTFEAVEGMTEESRKLMATREEEESQETSVEGRETSDQRLASRDEGQETRDKRLETREEKTDIEKLELGRETEKPIKPVKEETETKKFEALTEEKPLEIEKLKKIKRKKPAEPAASSEAERLAKLDEEIDNLLKDDL